MDEKTKCFYRLMSNLLMEYTLVLRDAMPDEAARNLSIEDVKAVINDFLIAMEFESWVPK